MRISDDNLHGRVVLSADGLAIGEVHKLFFNGAQFAIEAVEVKLRKEIAERLGIKHSTFHPATLEIPANYVQSVGDAVLLAARLDDLQALGAALAPNGKSNADVHEAQNVDVTR